MKTTLIAAAVLGLACLFVPACNPASQQPTTAQQATQPQDDMAIRTGMTVENVQAKLGKPTTVGGTYVTSYGEGPHKLYIYDMRPKGVFYVQFDTRDRVERTEWRDH